MLSNPIQSAIRLPVRSALGSAVFGPAVFDPASLFSSGSAGAWYDPSDFSTLYQTSTGTTPVTAVEQPVGLMLDRSRGLVLGSELVTNGDFSSSAGWTVPAGWTISGGAAQVNTPTATTNLYRNALTATKVYLVTTVVSEVTAGSVRTFIGSNSYTPIYTAPGTYLAVLRANSNGNIGLENDASFVGAVDSISARELPGNHATQDTSTSRPVLRARYNLLTFSEQFDNGAWTKTGTTVSANAGVAPDGTTTADKWQETAGGNGHVINRSVSVITGTQYTFSVYAKAGENNYVGLFGLKNSVGKFFNLSTGAVGNNIGSAPASATIESVGNGWYRCSITDTETATTSRNFEIYSSKNGTNWDYSGTLNDGILIWGAQLLTAADQTATGGAYQRIAAATDYDTSNPVFRPYLAFDGTDDSFSTSSIDFSATDEMTVFAGVHKASDTVAAMLVELSVNKNSNAGSFYITAPELSGASGNFATVFRGSVNNIYVGSGTILAPVTAVITAFGDISADSQTIRTNGIAVTDTPDMGTGNFGNYPLYICRRGDTSLPFNGRLYSLAVLGRTATVAEIRSTEQWVAGKTGVPSLQLLHDATDLQRLIALSPSLLIWPAQGAGWQGTSGGTLAASGQPLGLGADLSQLQGKTLSEWLAAPTTSELSTTTVPVTYTANVSVGSMSAATAGRVYVVEYTITASTGTPLLYASEILNPWIFQYFATTVGSHQYVLNAADAGAGSIFFVEAAGKSVTFSRFSVRELPGNHLRAGTWASPSDSARGMFQNNAINFDGVNDYYSLLNAISITTNMTVVRAFKRASAGVHSVGLATSSTFYSRDFYWANENTRQVRFYSGATSASANTSTGSFVSTSIARNGTQLFRINAAEIASGSGAVPNALDAFGLTETNRYNSGEISFLAVFPTELTGANLALVEQIAASTNGTTLA